MDTVHETHISQLNVPLINMNGSRLELAFWDESNSVQVKLTRQQARALMAKLETALLT